AQAGDLADRLDDLNLLGATFLEDDGELRLLLDHGRRRAARRATARRGRRDGHIELRLEGLDEVRELEHALVADGFEDLFVAQRGRCHVLISVRLRSGTALFAEGLEGADK